MRRATPIVAVIALLIAAAISSSAQDDDDSSRLTLSVLTAAKQPVADAHVVVKFTEPRMLRRDRRVSWEAKTNRKGVVVLTGIPHGQVKVQVIAKGYQTYGDEHQLGKPDEELTIELLPPKGQVSAY